MEVLTTVQEVRGYVKACRSQGKSIGLVPTMGFFHEGHLSLMRAARRECDVVVVSLFVNPTQFGPHEDYDRYPRDLERDRVMAQEVGVDLLFVPTVEEMYPPGYATYVEVERLTDIMCGRSRPGHFRGVATVVTKLFNIVQPDRAYFGQKDAQQALVIKRMVRDLNMPVDIRVMPIVREEDGLAMSSRNVYLSPEERQSALVLIKSLRRAEEMVRDGERSADRIKEAIRETIGSEQRARIDYVEVVDAEELKPLETIQGKALAAVAVFIGNARLIDNVILEG